MSFIYSSRPAAFTARSRNLRLGLPVVLGLTLTALLLWLCAAAPHVSAATGATPAWTRPDMAANVHPSSATGAGPAAPCQAVYTVDTTADAGVGTLRQALVDVCADGTITFAPALTASGPATITLTGTQLNVTKNMSITGPGASLLLVSGNNAHRVFNINSGVTAAISGLTIGNGRLTSGAGGGVQNAGKLTLSSTTVVSNSASQYGGGIYSTGSLTLTGAAILANTCPGGDGGGIYNYQGTVLLTSATIANNSGSSGGGVVNYGTLTVIDSTVVSNTAPGFYSGGTLYGGAGGGIFNGNNVAMTLTNATIMNNTAAKTGGGIYNMSKATAYNTTFADNAASTSGGGIYNTSALVLIHSSLSGNRGGGMRSTGSLAFTNTLVANSLVLSDCVSSGTIAVNTRNLVEDGSCSPALTGDPVVGAAGDYGGSTWTLPLLPGSPAIDTGSTSGCRPTDQRGVSRTAATCDIGAFESQRFTLTKGGGSNQSAVATAPFAQPFTATVAAGTWQGKSEPVFGGQVTFVGPASGAGVAPITSTATVDDGGVATIVLTANSTQGGPYQVSASAVGATPPIAYTGLTNVAPRPTTTTLTATPASPLFGELITITAAVTAATGTPTGWVTFTVDGGASVQPLVDAVATLTRTDLAVGDHAIAAQYGGGGGYLGSTASAITQTVARASAAITVTAAPNPAPQKSSVVLTATVSPAPPAGGTPTGVVTFNVGPDVITATLVGGVATAPWTANVAVGTYSVTADYGGDDNFAPASVAGADLVVACAPVHTVDTTADAGAGSLRQAIADVCAGGTINFDANLTASGPATITLTSGELSIGQDVTISGPGANLLAVSGNAATRVFVVNAGVNAILDGLTIRDGWVPNLINGAGILNSGVLTVTNSTLTANSAQENGGGAYNTGTLTVQSSMFSGNSALEGDGGGGGVYNTGTLTVQGSTFFSNSVPTGGGSGGGVYNTGTLTVQSSTFSSNAAPEGGSSGGGVYSTGMLTVQSSTFSSNAAYIGGGVANTGALTVQSSTFSSNTAFVGGGVTNEGALTVQSSTFSSNSASFAGGGVINSGVFTATNSTLANNAGISGGGLYNGSGKTLYLRNTLIADSVGGDCLNDGGTIAENTNNLVEDGSCSPALSGDPRLGTLGDYGGETATVPLLPGSPAIDAGDAGTRLATDQRGVARPQGGACDIGAFESQGFTATVSGGDGQHTFINTPFQEALTVTVASSHGEPVDGGVVMYTGPASSAGAAPGTATLSGLAMPSKLPPTGASIVTATATITGGQAAAQVFANATAGSYSASAGGAGLAGASFSLTNDPAAAADYEAVGGTGAYTFTLGAATVVITVTDTGGCLSGISAAQFDQDHPAATDPLKTGIYWMLTPYGCPTGFTVALLLPAGFVPDANDKVCRYMGSGQVWDCAASGFDAVLSTILRDGVTGFSDWTVGDHAGPTAVRVQTLRARPDVWAALRALLAGLQAR